MEFEVLDFHAGIYIYDASTPPRPFISAFVYALDMLDNLYEQE